MSLSQLNPEQYRAATTIEGPLLIIAGAGSGKTGVITHRIAYMLESGIPQSHILALTFTNKAAMEMEERLKKMTGKKLSNLTVSTFHAFGVKILHEKCALLGFRPNFTIYDAQDQLEAIKEAGRELNMVYDYDELKKAQYVFSSIKCGRDTWNANNRIYKELYQEYEEFLKLKNAFDFDDLIVKPIELFENNPAILEQYRKRYQYIMVDEFQDTSLLQYKFLRSIGLGSRNLCAVGDDDQSIYSWRGANYQNIQNFEADFPERVEIKLERNYRSTGAILDAANSIISNNSERKEKKLWTESKGKEAAIQARFLEDDQDESEFICSAIRSMRAADNRKYEDFGILVRTNSLMKGLEEALMNHSMPYSISGGSSFFDRKEIKDAIAYLRLADNPDDDISLLRIINTPRRGAGKQTLAAIRQYADQKKCPLFYAVKTLAFAASSPLSQKAKASLQEFIETIERFGSLLSSGKEMSASAKQLLEAIDYWGYLIQEYKDKDTDKIDRAKWRYDNVLLFLSFFERWEKNPDNLNPHLHAYLTRIALSSRDKRDENEDGKVSLMTIHAAKGLEFNIVFIAGVEDTIIPHARSVAEDPANLEEERRLFYVAVTRARERLYLTVCRQRRTLRETIECKPSPFLMEIPKRLIETQEVEHSAEERDNAAKSTFRRFAKHENQF